MVWHGYLFSYGSKASMFAIMQLLIYCSSPGNADTCDDGNKTMIEAETIASYKRSNGNILNLYQTNSSLTWCDAYQQCRKLSKDSDLIVILDNQTQLEIKQLMMKVSIPDNNFAWISAERKDFGSGWTWVTDDLIDCSYDETYPPDRNLNCSSHIPEDGREYGRLLVDPDYPNQQTNDESSPSGTYRYICKIGNKVNESSVKSSGWYDAQNECVNKNGRLATYGEAFDLEENRINFWNGLQYRPWIWKSENGYRTLYYSNWDGSPRAHVGDDCLSLYLDSNAQWKENNCSATLGYFICEETIQPPTTEASETKDPEESVGGRSNKWKIGLGIGLGVGIAVVVAIVLGVYFGVCARKKKKNGSVSDMDNGKVNEGLDMKNETGEEGRTDGYGSNGFPSLANNNFQSDYDEINDPKQFSKNTSAPNTAPPPKPPRVEPDPTYELATDPQKQVNIVGNPYIISPYSEVELNQFPTRNALDDNRGSRIMVDNTMYGGTIDHEPKQKPGILNKPPPGKPKAPEKPPKPTSLKKPQVAAITPVRHTFGPKGDEYAEIQKVDTIKK